MNSKSGYPDDNPKTVLGVQKVPLNLVPPSAKHFLAEAFADGAGKYGPYNWRDKTVSASIYYGAAQRHMDDWWDGEDLSHDAKVHHLAHAMACLAIVLDAMTVGRLNDDRPAKGAASMLQREYADKLANKKKQSEEGKIEHLRFTAGTGIIQDHARDRAGANCCGAQDPVEYGGVPDVQADLFPSETKYVWIPEFQRYLTYDRGVG